MGFEDDFDYSDQFETEAPDPDFMDAGEKPKKLSRRELREAKKKNAEKTADLPRHRKGFFGRHERLDDSDESLTDDHIFDPAQTTMVSSSPGRRQRSAAPVRNTESEFSYLFDPVGDDESEDDVYPEKSIYSDAGAARDLLAGLSYDESKDDGSGDFDRYFEEHSMPAESEFSLRREDTPPESDNAEFDDDFADPEPQPEQKQEPKQEPPAKPAAPVKVIPKKPDPASQPQPEERKSSFLSGLRQGSFFGKKSEPTAPVRNDPPLPPLKSAEETRLDDDFDDYYEDDYDMSHDQDKENQDFIPYGGMYPAYPMTPMNQMMSYPVVIPGGQQQGGIPIQTIPIPYPMPMPMPMPMYGQYPPYSPQYPPYPPQDPYGRYPDYDDRGDRGRRRFNEHRRDSRRDDRYDDRRDERYDERYDDRRDARYDDRRDARYDDRRDARYDDRRDDPYDRQDDRRTYPRAPYDPPYRSPEQETQPVRQPERFTPAPEPITSVPEPINAAASEQEQPRYTSSPFAGMDFSFRTPVHSAEGVDKAGAGNRAAAEKPAADPVPQTGSGAGSFGNDPGNDGFSDDLGGDGFGDDLGGDGFGDNLGGDGFGDNLGGDGFSDDLGGDGFSDDLGGNAGNDAFGDDSDDEDGDFGLGFGGRSISSDRPSQFSDSGSRPSSGRFKKK